jgi:hypothetical protein
MTILSKKVLEELEEKRKGGEKPLIQEFPLGQFTLDNIYRCP